MSAHDYHINAEADVGGTTNRHIIFYFVLLAVSLFVTIGGLTIMYRFQADYEKKGKIGAINTRESLDYAASMESFLSGRSAVLPHKRNVPIDIAMRRFIDQAR